MEYKTQNTNNELTHWGIKGMRWGIRRYQNADGSLTKAGQKRYNDELAAVRKGEKILKNRKSVQAKMDKLAARKQALKDNKKQFDDEQKKAKRGSKKTEKDDAKAAKKEAEKEAKKSVKDMGDEELAYRIRRIQLENQYNELTAKPETVAKGNGFVKDFMAKAAVPAIQEAGRTLVRDSILKLAKKRLGLETEDLDYTVKKLEREYKTLDFEDKIKDLKNKAAKAAEKEKAKQAEKEKKKTETSEEKTFTGTVTGDGTSTRNSGKKWSDNSPIYDVDYTDVVNSDNTSSGRRFVSGYLTERQRLGLPEPKG